MACGFGACYGCVVELGGQLRRLCLEGPVLTGPRCSGGAGRDRRGCRRMILNGSGCLDALATPDVAQALDVVRDEDGHAAPPGGKRPGPDRGERGRDAELDRSREPRHRPLPGRVAARARRASASRSGSRSGASARLTTQSLCDRLDGRDEVAAIELNLSCPNVQAPDGGVDRARGRRPLRDRRSRSTRSSRRLSPTSRPSRWRRSRRERMGSRW